MIKSSKSIRTIVRRPTKTSMIISGPVTFGLTQCDVGLEAIGTKPFQRNLTRSYCDNGLRLHKKNHQDTSKRRLDIKTLKYSNRISATGELCLGEQIKSKDDGPLKFLNVVKMLNAQYN
jgi:hypothetical protein